MRESRSKLDVTADLNRAILEKRKKHVASEGMKTGDTVYLLPRGRTPYEITGFIKESQKMLMLLRAVNSKDSREFSTNPILYTTKKPEKPKKPHRTRHG